MRGLSRTGAWTRVEAVWTLIFLAPLALAFSSAASPSGTDDSDLDRRIDALLRVFEDPEARGAKLDETRKAHDALVAMGKPAVGKLIDAYLLDPRKRPELVASSYGVLKAIGKDAVEPIRLRWSSLKDADRWKFMELLGKHDYQTVLPYAIESLDAKAPTIREQAYAFLCVHKEEQAKARLVKALNAETPKLRWGLISGLAIAYPKDEEVVNELNSLLSVSSWAAKGQGRPPLKCELPPWWPDGRSEPVYYLGQLNAKRSAPAMLKVLAEKGQGRAYLGEFIIPLLGQFGYKESIPELRRILATDGNDLARALVPPEGIHLFAGQALCRLGHPWGRIELIYLLQPKYGVLGKRLASRFLAQVTGDKGDLWILACCLNDEIDEVRGWACAGLERITGIVNRAPNRAVSTEDDAPLWREWCSERKHEFIPLVHWDGAGLRRENIPQKQRLGETQLQSLWDDLAASESAKAYRAMEALVAAPEQAVTLIKDRLLRVDPAKEKQIAKWIADLDDADFQSRERATQELEKHGLLIQKAITAALRNAGGTEARRRLERLQARLNSSVVVTMPATLRLIRAVAVLEEIRTLETRPVLEKLASGASEDFLTQEARAAILRLAKSGD